MILRKIQNMILDGNRILENLAEKSFLFIKRNVTSICGIEGGC